MRTGEPGHPGGVGGESLGCERETCGQRGNLAAGPPGCGSFEGLELFIGTRLVHQQ